MAHSSVALVNMPWALLRAPSIQLSTLKPLLARHGVGARVFNFALDWMHVLHDAGFVVDDYTAISDVSHGLGDWVFAVPPFREPSAASDEAFRQAFVDWDTSREPLYALATRMRPHVPAFLDACVERILREGVRVVGFTSTFQQNVASLLLARALKARDADIVTVFGGANCDGVMGATIHREFPFVDVVVRGEAEAIAGPLFAELVAGKKLSTYPGVCHREGGERIESPQGGALPEMHDVPTPDHDDYFRDVATMPFVGDVSPVCLPFESARGCWWGQKHHCTFCGLNGTSMRFRSKTASRTRDEIVAMAGRYGVTRFAATDNIIEMGYFDELLPELASLNLDLAFFYETKANLKKSQVAAMAAAGVYEIQPGIESLDTSVLSLMKKGTTALQNVRLLKWALEHHIRVAWNVIFGFPGEDPAAYRRMADLVPSLLHLEPPNCSTLEIHRFSPYHAEMERFPLRITGPKAFYEHVYPLDARTLMDIAYTFAFEYTQPQDVATYAAPLVEGIERWAEVWPKAKLEMRRGVGMIEIEDTRALCMDGRRAMHRLDAVEAKIYALLDASATPAAVAHALAKDASHGETVPSASDVERFLDELVGMRLVCEEDGRYLSLAIPARPPR